MIYSFWLVDMKTLPDKMLTFLCLQFLWYYFQPAKQNKTSDTANLQTYVMECFTYNNDMDVAGQWSWILLLKEFPCLSGNIACHWHACDRTDCRFLRLYQLFSLLIYHKYPIFVSYLFFCNFTIAIIFCSTFMKKKNVMYFQLHCQYYS